MDRHSFHSAVASDSLQVFVTIYNNNYNSKQPCKKCGNSIQLDKKTFVGKIKV